MGQGEVGECIHRVQTAWVLLSLAVESPWLALGGPFLSLLCMNGLRKQSSGRVGSPFLAVKHLFWLCRDDLWPRAVTIEKVGVV